MLAGALLAKTVLAADDPGSTAAPSLSAAQRYDAARQLMQRGSYLEAAEMYRGVAESDDAPPALRAQALFACGLMQENARNYERAIAIYHETERRFAGTEFARHAAEKARALETGGPVRAIAFRKRWDAAWDELRPAQALVDRDEWRAARPGLQRAAALFTAILRDFDDQPKAKDVALALGDTHMTLRQFDDARADYARAIALARRQGAEEHGAGTDSFVLSAEQRLAEALRAYRRQWAARIAAFTLGVIGVPLLALRPWRALDALLVRLAGSLAIATSVLAALAMGIAVYLKYFTQENSPVGAAAAALLVAIPGLTGQIVTLSLVRVFRRLPRWSGNGLAAALGAVAALAAAVCLVDALALFPYLDNKL